MKSFSRWAPLEKSTWVGQVFKNYHAEYVKNLNSYILSNKFIYTKLAKDGASWEDELDNHFDLSLIDRRVKKSNLKGWSDSFNKFEKWVYLNSIMALSSNFEIYLNSIVILALQSDPGLLLGSPKKIDGVSILKYGNYKKLNLDDYALSIVKGDWNSRINSFEKIFGNSPDILKEKLSELEAIRKLRNQVGHAFGREIEASKNFSVKNIRKVDTISRERLFRYSRIIWSSVKEIDSFLLNKHIGTYQFLLFYHNMYDSLNKKGSYKDRALQVRKRIGQSKVRALGKPFYQQMVKYYESI